MCIEFSRFGINFVLRKELKKNKLSWNFRFQVRQKLWQNSESNWRSAFKTESLFAEVSVSLSFEYILVVQNAESGVQKVNKKNRQRVLRRDEVVHLDSKKKNKKKSVFFRAPFGRDRRYVSVNIVWFVSLLCEFFGRASRCTRESDSRGRAVMNANMIINRIVNVINMHAKKKEAKEQNTWRKWRRRRNKEIRWSKQSNEW